MSASPAVAPAFEYAPMTDPHWDDPYPRYRELRDQPGLYWSDEVEAFCVSRFDDVSRVLRDPALFSSVGAFDALLANQSPRIGPRELFEIGRFLWRTGGNPLRFARGFSASLVTEDPPRHDEIRAIVNRGFTPRRIAAWEPRVSEIVKECIERIRSRDTFDLVKELAEPVPLRVIAEMLGVDPGRQDDFRRWTQEGVAAASGSARVDSIAAILRPMGEISAIVRKVAAKRRREPQDDLMSALVDSTRGEVLASWQAVEFAYLLLAAGNETTTNLIGSAVALLLDHPDQLERVLRDPSLLPGLVEESMRMESPVQLIFRRATRDVEVAGTRVPKDSRLLVMIGAANRDERRFPDPDRFDPGRDTTGHAAFGFGVHFCLGASLARLEARHALEGILPELPSLRHRDPQREWVDSRMVRGPRRLVLERA